MTKPNSESDTPNPAIPTQAKQTQDTPSVAFTDLAKGHRIVHIVHGESVYELRLTRNGRLVLYK